MRQETIGETIKDIQRDIEYERQAYHNIKNIQRFSKHKEDYDETLNLIEENGEFLKQQLKGALNGKLPY